MSCVTFGHAQQAFRLERQALYPRLPIVLWHMKTDAPCPSIRSMEDVVHVVHISRYVTLTM
ncbi:MAG: hypothetical protein GYA34_15545 [Chloroflexi bacterium]|nr:hypothetical protein [Chloroflexota bacterium]